MAATLDEATESLNRRSICERCGEAFNERTGRHYHNDSNLCEDMEKI